MTTKTINCYNFDELSPEIQDRLVCEHRYVHVDYFDWYHSVYDDAKEIGLRITAFDLDRQHIEGDLFFDGFDVAQKIILNHGEHCETHKLSVQFLSDYKNLPDDDDFEYLANELEEEFLKSLLEEYLVILRHDFEYHTSDEAVLDYLKNSDCVYDINGNEI